MSVPSCDVCGAETFAYVDGKPVTRCPECMGCTCGHCYDGKHLHGLDESDGTCPTCPVHQVDPYEYTFTVYATFGQKYAHETHPTLPFAHPDGWLTVTAPNEQIAYRALQKATTPPGETVPHYAFTYSDPRELTLYPRGELALITVDARENTTTTIRREPVTDWSIFGRRLTPRINDYTRSTSRGPICGATWIEHTCTRRPGHTGRHAEGNGQLIDAVWSGKDTP